MNVSYRDPERWWTATSATAPGSPVSENEAESRGLVGGLCPVVETDVCGQWVVQKVKLELSL